MTEIYNTTGQRKAIRERRYITQQQTVGETHWYGEHRFRTRFGAILSAWFSGVVSGNDYNFRVVDTKGEQ